MQRWGRAFRDNDYHAAVDTNKGVEAQNRLFKYMQLSSQKQAKGYLTEHDNYPGRRLPP